MSSDLRAMRAVRRGKILRRINLFVRYIVLTAVGATMILPFVWMVSTSLKDKDTAVEIPPKWIPRQSAAYARIDGQSTLVRVLKYTTTVRRIDTGETAEVYSQAVKPRTAGWKWWKKPSVTANIARPDGSLQREVPVEVLDAKAMVRIIEEGPRRLEVLTIPAGDVAEKSWVRLEWRNYPVTWSKLPFGRSYINTAFIALSITFGQLLTCSLAAFAFARLRFPGRDALFFGYLATMMIPGAVTLIPVYILFVKMPEVMNLLFQTDWFSNDLYFLGRYYVGRLVGGNSFFALIAPGLFSAYGTFMLRQFFMNLSRDLEDAARIDGCGNLRVYWHVTVPLSQVSLATLGTFVFMGSWKTFMWPLIIINREELLPLQVLLQRLRGQYHSDFHLLMAGSIIVLIPLLAAFLFGQKYFVQGIQLGGVKG